MEHSMAEMTCVLKVSTQCEACKVKVMRVLQRVRGVYNITIDGEEGTVKVTGRVNPSTLLKVLEKYGKHAEVKYIKFEGEVMERNPRYYGEYGGYAPPYGMEYGAYPSLPSHQHQWYQPSFDFPHPPHPPPLAPYPVAPPPYWPPPLPPYGPPPLTSFRMPRPPNHVPTGETSRPNRQSHCAMM